MPNEGYLIGYEDVNGNFVEIGQFNNAADDVTKPLVLRHTNSGATLELDGSSFRPSTQIGDTNNRPSIFADTVNANGLAGNIKNQGCRVFLSSNQSLSQSTTTKINFDSSVYDSDNNFDTATNAWTCPQNGLYAVNLQVFFGGGTNGDLRSVRIGNNTSSAPSGEGAHNRETNSALTDRISVSTINKYNSGDTVVAYAENKQNTDTVESGNTAEGTFLEVAFIGGV